MYCVEYVLCKECTVYIVLSATNTFQEVVQRFLLQGETQKHLEKLKFDNEKTLLRLREEKVQYLYRI